MPALFSAALKTTCSPLQIGFFEDVVATVGVVIGFMKTAMKFDVIRESVWRRLLVARMQLTTLPFCRLFALNAFMETPVFTPFTCHWKDGLVPPFFEADKKLITAPRQTFGLGLAISRPGVKRGSFEIVIALDSLDLGTNRL